MAKRKRNGSANSDVVAFRPSAFIRDVLGDLAAKWQISPGEVAKRLVVLQVHDLDTGFYAVVNELSDLLIEAPGFEHACQMIHVKQVEEVHPSKRTLHSHSDRESRLQIARSLIQQFRTMRGLTEDAREKLRISIVHRDG